MYNLINMFSLIMYNNYSILLHEISYIILIYYQLFLFIIIKTIYIYNIKRSTW